MPDRKPVRVAREWGGVLLAGLLSACGGGGGTRADPPPVSPPPTSPPPAPPDTPPVVEPPNPAYGQHLALTGADLAHEAGWTGDGIRIGVVDSGVNRSHPALSERVVANLTYIDPNANDLSVDDVVGHGTAVAQVIAGQPFGQWPGGIAPEAEIVSARIISDEPPEDDGSGEGNEVDGALGLAPIHRDLIDRGARIMNNSWGGLYWTNPAATAPIADEYRPFIVDHGGLVVFSTGNAGFDDPSDMAALPSQAGTGGATPAADLERGWIAVTALDADDPLRLAEYANACGIAMHYCLAAPGTVVVTGNDDAPDAPEYWRWSGTSFSAPIVSGAAALVWEAFPYFDNDLVRQTLLGTATDLGAPGVDAVFGNGAVDIAAAVRGPSRLDWGDMTVRFDGITSAWGNPLSGDGALIKEGSGTLRLDAADIGNLGGLQVRGGRLVTNGDIAGDVLVGRAGTFVPGFGEYVEGTVSPAPGLRIGGSLDNAGRVELRGLTGAPASPNVVSQTRVEGDYLQRDGATLAVELGRQLSVTGNVVLEGGELHVLGTMPGYTASSRETVLLSQGGVEGEFDTLGWAGTLFLDAEIQYGPNVVDLFIRRLDVAAAARSMARMTPAALSASDRVEAAFQGLDAGGAATEEFSRIAGEFQHLEDEARARAALDSLSGESHALATSLAFDAIDMGRRALSSRFGALRPGNGDAGAWKQSLGQGGRLGLAGGGFALDGWMLGRDQALSGGLVGGFAFGESRADGRVGGNRDRSRERQTQASLYLGRLFADGYALAQAGFGQFDRDLERGLFSGAEMRAGVAGAYSGDFSTLGVEAGRLHRIGGVDVASYLGADHVRLGNDAFREWGSGFALRADAATLRRTQAVAGLRAGFDWRGARLHAYSEWQQVLDADGFDVAASFVGIDSWAPLPLAAAAKSGGMFGIGIEAGLGRNAALSLGFDQRFGPRGDERMGSVRYAFGF